MESSALTQQLEPASRAASAHTAITEVHAPMFAAIKEQCSACHAAMASDQRYCVECGERRGPPRVPVTGGLAQLGREEPAAPRAPRRPRRSLDSALIAGVGTLLLAMGVGVLIGRSGTSGRASSPRVQVVRIAGGGTASGEAGTIAATPAAPGVSAASPKAGAGHGAAGGKSKRAATAAPKPVTIGSPGHGPGYKNGHFTGTFFGE